MPLGTKRWSSIHFSKFTEEENRHREGKPLCSRPDGWLVTGRFPIFPLPTSPHSHHGHQLRTAPNPWIFLPIPLTRLMGPSDGSLQEETQSSFHGRGPARSCFWITDAGLVKLLMPHPPKMGAKKAGQGTLPLASSLCLGWPSLGL